MTLQLRGAAQKLAMVLAVLSLGACTDYIDRKETISFSAGDAVAHNVAVHMLDPWPVHARNTTIASSGHRAARAARRYENCYSTEARASLGTTSSIQTSVTCSDALQ